MVAVSPVVVSIAVKDGASTLPALPVVAVNVTWRDSSGKSVGSVGDSGAESSVSHSILRFRSRSETADRFPPASTRHLRSTSAFRTVSRPSSVSAAKQLPNVHSAGVWLIRHCQPQFPAAIGRTVDPPVNTYSLFPAARFPGPPASLAEWRLHREKRPQSRRS